MADPHVTHSSQASSHTSHAGPKQGSPIRLIVLVVLLLAAIGLVAHDWFVAQPAAQKTNADLQEKVDAANASSIVDAQGNRATGMISPEQVQEWIGRKPDWTKNEADHMLESYRHGPVPGRQYVVVMYHGPEGKRHYVMHLLNTMPEEADYPSTGEPVQDSAANAPDPAAAQKGQAQQPAEEAEPKQPAAESDEPASEAKEPAEKQSDVEEPAESK